jgi:hypothetical protein
VDEVKFDFTSFLIQYRSCRVQRLMGTRLVSPLLDARAAAIAGHVCCRHCWMRAAALPPGML